MKFHKHCGSKLFGIQFVHLAYEKCSFKAKSISLRIRIVSTVFPFQRVSSTKMLTRRKRHGKLKQCVTNERVECEGTNKM